MISWNILVTEQLIKFVMNKMQEKNTWVKSYKESPCKYCLFEYEALIYSDLEETFLVMFDTVWQSLSHLVSCY